MKKLVASKKNKQKKLINDGEKMSEIKEESKESNEESRNEELSLQK